MCVYSMSEIKVLEKNTYFYKLVRKNKNPDIFFSLILPISRNPQYPDFNKHSLIQDVGTKFYYKIGKEITSNFENTPGM